MESNKHGGFRNNAGRKPLPENAKKKTSVIRIDAELLPLVEKLKQGLPVTQNQVWQQTTALTEDDLKEQANCIERLMSENTLLKATNAQLDKELQKIKIDSTSQLQTQNKALKQALSLVQNDFAEQGALLMKLIKEKKNLEINLALKANVKQKVESIPSPVKVNPINQIKANPNQLQGISGATAKTAKVTLVVEPSSIPRVDSTGKKQTVLKIAVDSMIFQADLNSKSYRKAIATIDELGAENCNAILQGAMKTQGKLEGVGLVIQAKKAKEDSPVNNET